MVEQGREEVVESSRFKKAYDTTAGFFKGSKVFNWVKGKDINIKWKTDARIDIIDTSISKSPMIRIDRPHANLPTPHININPEITGVPDPHIPLPAGGPAASKALVNTCQFINTANKVLIPLSIAFEAYRVGKSAYADYDTKTTRNTTETITLSGVGYAGGYGGMLAGSAAGTAIVPGLGTILGGIVGAIGGGIGSSIVGSTAFNKISDYYNYNIEEVTCVACGELFKRRKYKKEENDVCESCLKKMNEEEEDDGDEGKSSSEDKSISNKSDDEKPKTL